MCQDLKIPLLGKVPLDPHIGESLSGPSLLARPSWARGWAGKRMMGSWRLIYRALVPADPPEAYSTDAAGEMVTLVGR